MCETSGLTGASIDGNSDINDIANIAEELVEISIGHFECQVADEEGLGRWVGFIFASGDGLVVDYESAPFINCLVLCFNGGGCLFSGCEFNVSKSVDVLISFEMYVGNA